MKKQSAGLLLYRWQNKKLEILLVHPGGPFWKNKDDGSWSIPKGEYNDEESPLDAAIRETEEEIGKRVVGKFIELTPVKLKSGKVIHAWAVNAEFDADTLNCNFFEMEWPPKSGLKQSFPEVDRAAWFSIDGAKQKINSGQIPLIEQLEKIVPSIL